MLYHIATTLPLMVCLVWTIIFWAEFPRLDPPRRCLAVFGVVTTLLYACHFVHFEGTLPFGVADCLWCFCTLSVYPLYRLYVLALTTQTPPPRLRTLLWFVPALGMTCWGMWVLVRGGDPQLLRSVIGMVDCGLSLVVAADCFFRLDRYRKSVRNFYADTEGKLLMPVFWLLVLLVVISLASGVASLVGRDRFYGSLLLLVPSSVFSSLLFGIFLVGYHTVRPAEEVRLGETAAPVTDDVPLRQLMVRIEREIIIGERFRTPGLKISDVAEAVGSNRSYVSSAINQVAGLPFADYVNRFRVRYAQELIRGGGRNIPLSEVAERSGFADRVSFYRGFKKETGLSPSEWMDSFYDLQH